MCNKVVENYFHALEFVLDCYKTKKKCDEDVDICPSTLKFVPLWFMAQECNEW